MSLNEMTFSCRRCLSSLSSRYVRFARTGVLKGFIIFFTATFWFVSWSRAELSHAKSVSQSPRLSGAKKKIKNKKNKEAIFREATVGGGERRKMKNVPNEAEGAHADWLEIRVPRGDLEGGPKDLRSYELRHLE